MARQCFTENITGVAADGTVKALSNVLVTVKNGGTSDEATGKLYTNRSGGSAITPHWTSVNSSGLVTFWADKGDYDIVFHDLEAIPRISDYTLSWTSNPIQEVPTGFSVGDIKFSSKNADHDNWLKMDGRQLTQAQIEAALPTIGAGGGLAIVTELGTGGSSKYGTASADNIKLPDTRRVMPLLAGDTGDGSGSFSARPLKGAGSSGGAETVTLTGGQSGIQAHSHGVGSIAAADATPAITVSVANTTPAITVNDPGHTHPMGLTNAGSATGGPDLFRPSPQISNTPSAVTGITAKQAAHNHSATATQVAHSHSMSGSTAAATAVAASDAHTNMPPFVVIGYAFIRV